MSRLARIFSGVAANRLAWIFAGVAVAVALPALLLVAHAREGVRLERELRYRAISERVYDEMERALSLWLAEEEARPVDHYRFYLGGDGRSDQRRISPLADPPEQPFVMAYFQVDSDGSFHTPERPRDVYTAIRMGDYRPDPQREEVLDELERAVGGSFATWRAPDDAEEESLEGEAVPLPAADSSREAALEVKKEAPTRAETDDAEKKDYDVYSALSSLNRGAEVRRQRRATHQEQVAVGNPIEVADNRLDGVRGPGSSSPPPLARTPGRVETRDLSSPAPGRSASPTAKLGAAGFEAADEVALGTRDEWDDGTTRSETRSRAQRPAAEPSVSQTAKRNAPAEEPTGGLAAAADAVPQERSAPAKGSVPPSGGSSSGKVSVAPFRGSLLPRERLLLLRRVEIPGGFEAASYQQGLLVDSRALHAWLRDDALAAARLGGAEFVFRRSGVARETIPSGFAYGSVHRFAEPFDGWELELRLAPLAGLRTELPIYFLSGLFLLAAGVGLFAVYRMVSVRLAFAERRSNFVAAVSHELKTPLTAIRMYAEMLRDGMVPSDEKRQACYASITAESERLSRLINNVLEFSRLEQLGREIQLEDGDIAPLVRQVAAWLTPHAESEGFEIDVQVANSTPAVRFERDAVSQILFNLVDNAIKYASEAEAKQVGVTCGYTEEGVVVAVRDQGPGVAPEHLAQIFDPFFRGESELTRTAKGAGIGLALAKRLAEKMGAQLSGKNLGQGGFEARLTFPLAGPLAKAGDEESYELSPVEGRGLERSG